jgi:hypothetical protein
MLGRGPGRWVTANGFILFFATCVYFNSISSQRAMGHLRFMVVLGFFFSGGSQRRGGRVWTFRKDPRAIVVIFPFLGVFVEFGRDNCICIQSVRLYICMHQCMFSLNEIQIRILKKNVAPDTNCQTPNFPPDLEVDSGELRGLEGRNGSPRADHT